VQAGLGCLGGKPSKSEGYSEKKSCHSIVMTDLRRLFKQKDTSSGGKRVFATVGTTKFDELVAALDTEEVQEALRDQGFSTLVVQKG
jgi:hypothetical protein